MNKRGNDSLLAWLVIFLGLVIIMAFFLAILFVKSYTRNNIEGGVQYKNFGTQNDLTAAEGFYYTLNRVIAFNNQNIKIKDLLTFGDTPAENLQRFQKESDFYLKSLAYYDIDNSNNYFAAAYVKVLDIQNNPLGYDSYEGIDCDTTSGNGFILTQIINDKQVVFCIRYKTVGA
jgi:hypothetical protein